MLSESTAQYNIWHLARDWKVMVDEWITESTPESMKASVVDEEEGKLPFPPLDDLAFFATQTTSIEFSKVGLASSLSSTGSCTLPPGLTLIGFPDSVSMSFFDGNGNLRNSEELSKSHENGRKALLERKNPARKEQFSESTTAAPKDRKGEQQNKQTSVFKPNKPFLGYSGTGRPTKPTSKRKLNNDDMKLLKKSDKGTIRKRHVSSQQNKLKCSDEDAARMKFEATKRKLQEQYEEAEKGMADRRSLGQKLELFTVLLVAYVFKHFRQVQRDKKCGRLCTVPSPTTKRDRMI